MNKATEKRLVDIEGIVAEMQRRSDPANDPLMQLSPEDRELLERYDEAWERGEHREITPELMAALQRKDQVLREALKAGGPHRWTPAEAEKVIAILHAGRERVSKLAAVDRVQGK